MGIRDVSYYGWDTIEQLGGTKTIPTASYNDLVVTTSGSTYVVGSLGDIDQGTQWVIRESKEGNTTWSTIFLTGGVGRGIEVDSSGALYAVGVVPKDGFKEGAIVLKSHITASNSWTEIYESTGGGSSRKALTTITIDSQDNIYAFGRQSDSSMKALSSSDRGQTWASQSIGSIPVEGPIVLFGSTSDKVGESGLVFVGGGEAGNTEEWHIVSSSDYGATFTEMELSESGFNSQCAALYYDQPNSNLYAGGYYEPHFDQWVCYLKRFNLSTGWQVLLDETTVNVFSGAIVDVGVDSNGNIYCVGTLSGSNNHSIDEFSDNFNPSILKYAVYVSYDDGVSWKVVDSVGSAGVARSMVIDKEDNIWTAGVSQRKFGVVKKGKLVANSASIGPTMLNTSFGYVASEVSGVITEKFKLNNISEFPYSSGFFQMPNLVVGTTDSGKIGFAEDSIVQVRYFGSIVHVAWPKQEDQEIPVKGFGDFSVGTRSGKLLAQFEPGNSFDVTEYDHMSLYCYLLKQSSGTLDNIEVKIERRPLKSLGYATEQSIEYSTSGSSTVAELKDLVYKKEIDYGDLTIKEIGFPIDVPLENTKEIRISAKHSFGQDSDSNKNLIIWARLIKSEEET